MALSSQFIIGQSYSFTTHAQLTLGTFTDVTVEGILNYDAAVSYGSDIAAMHANVYPSLPPGSVENDPRKYQYILITRSNGSRQILGLPWIEGSSVTQVTVGDAEIGVTGVSPDDFDRLRRILASNNVQVTYVRAKSV